MWRAANALYQSDTTLAVLRNGNVLRTGTLLDQRRLALQMHAMALLPRE